MKKIFIGLLILCSILQASHIRWYGDYEKALIIAKKQNKPLMLFIRKKNCNDCQKMLETTFINQPYIDKINKEYISIIATYEDENSYPIELFYTQQFPALFFISSKDESFLRDPLLGYTSANKIGESLP